MNLPAIYEKLTPAKRKQVREQYVELQKGLCHYCGYNLSEKPPAHISEKRITPSLYPPNFFKYPIHLHHSHETGLTLGAVHNYCNAILWEYHDE